MVRSNDATLPGVYEALRAEFEAVRWFEANPSLEKLDDILCSLERLLPADYAYPDDSPTNASAGGTCK